MKLISALPIKCSLILLSLSISFSVSAIQKDTSSKPKPVDSTTKDFVSRVRKAGIDEAKRSVILFNREKEEIKQDQLIEEVKKITQKAMIHIRTGIDSAGIDNELEKVKSWSKFVGDGIFTNKGTAQTHRNLTTTSKIFGELLARTNKRKKEIDAYEKDLINFRFKIDSLYADSSIYDFPKDSVQIVKYMRKLIIVVKEIGPADTAIKYAISNVRKLQEKTDLIVLDLGAKLKEIDDYQKELSVNSFEREFSNLGADVGYKRPISQILYFSNAKADLIFLFFAQNNPGRIFLIFLFIGIAVVFLRSLKQIITQEDAAFDDLPGQLILRHFWLSAIVIVLNVGQFIFPEPPFVFNCLFWIISAVCLTFIFKSFITKYWMNIWLTFLTLFILSCADNLILQASRLERWWMFFLALAGVITGVSVFVKGKKTELREKLIIYFIGLAVLLELASVFANIFGRYNFSKTLLVGGYLNVIVGILFLWTIRLINQGLSIASKVYTQQDRKLFYINFDLVGDRAPTLFYLFMIDGWFILFGRNFYVFRLLTDPLKAFFFNERTIGKYSFSINSLLVFFLILSISVISSKIVSYFASGKSTVHVLDKKERKAGVGSWLLLIRVGIISIGLFLALAASGFPMDRITIIIGALGVGVGFGLQTLVNNLVSGLIIAFEKPVNVGDIVEISGAGGTVKSIGFRSSIISKWDGPDMVIPNGDLLNSHLVNWTLAGSKRQMTIAVGIAYGTDLQKCEKIIAGLIKVNKRIHEHPAPSVQFKNFNSNAIEIEISFWVREYKDGAAVKSEIIAAIDKAFRENDMVIPFSQQDIYIHQPDKDKEIKADKK